MWNINDTGFSWLISQIVLWYSRNVNMKEIVESKSWKFELNKTSIWKQLEFEFQKKTKQLHV